MQRIKWIDYSKAFAIYCVVLLHLYCDPMLSKCINGFVMPLFFMMSGYLFSYDDTYVGLLVNSHITEVFETQQYTFCSIKKMESAFAF